MYIDDGVYAAESRDQCVEGTKMIIDDLTSAEFITPHACARGKVIGRVVVVVSTKITIS